MEDLINQFNVLGVKDGNCISINEWQHLVKPTKNMSQLDYYKINKAHPVILKLVELESKQFGSQMELLMRDYLCIQSRSSTQNDGVFNGHKLEIKVARYWSCSDECIWQHLEPEHDYDTVLMVLLGFQGIYAWAVSKELLMGKLRDNKVVTYQGKQGFWTKKSRILNYLTQINSTHDLKSYLDFRDIEAVVKMYVVALVGKCRSK